MSCDQHGQQGVTGHVINMETSCRGVVAGHVIKCETGCGGGVAGHVIKAVERV